MNKNLNKLTKKELVEYGDSLSLSLNIKDKKEVLISKFTCSACCDKFSRENIPYGVWLWTNSETTLDTRVYDESFMFCAVCHIEWGYPDTGEKIGLNPRTGKLRYVPINSEEKFKIFLKGSALIHAFFSFF